MENCIVTKLKASVDNPNLPIFESMQQFTLDAIAASGNMDMTDEQKWILNHFFYQIGAISNNDLWQKIDLLLIPVIAAGKDYFGYNYKTGLSQVTMTERIIDTHGGLESYFGGEQNQTLLSTSFSFAGNSLNAAMFTSCVKGYTMNNGAIQSRVTYQDSSVFSILEPRLNNSFTQIGIDSGNSWNYRNTVRDRDSLLLNIKGSPTVVGNVEAWFGLEGSTNKVTNSVSIPSGNYIDTSEKETSTIKLGLDSGLPVAITLLFNQSLTESEVKTIFKLSKMLNDAFPHGA